MPSDLSIKFTSKLLGGVIDNNLENPGYSKENWRIDEEYVPNSIIGFNFLLIDEIVISVSH